MPGVTKLDSPQQIGEQTPRLRDLCAAKNRPVSVTRDTPLIKALTLMRIHDFSQLPVIHGEREVDVKGYVSWRTIGEAYARGEQCATVNDCMCSDVATLDEATPLLEAVSTLVHHDFILVEAPDHKIIGIVTTSDITSRFHALAEPFFLIGRIEQELRRILTQSLSNAQIKQARDIPPAERDINGASDLTLGGCIRLLAKHKASQELAGYSVSWDVAIEQLDKVRDIRNDVMHFRPNGIPLDAVSTLRNVASFLAGLPADAVTEPATSSPPPVLATANSAASVTTAPPRT